MIFILRQIRVLQRHWKLAAVAVFSLSIAMALGILSLSITNTFLLLPPTAAAPDRLVMIHGRTPGEQIGQISYPDYKYYRENNHVFTDIAATPNSIHVNFNFEGDREVKVVARPVSDNYFTLLRIRPYLGNFFSPGDDNAKSPIAVMTYACWKRLGSDPRIVGKTITRYTIIGVTPREFTGSFYGLNGDLLIPLSLTQDDANANTTWLTKRDSRQLFLIGRLKPGITKRQAQAEMTNLSGQLASAYPKEDKDLRTVVTRATMLPPDAIPDAELALAILILVVLLVLLIACANVANLLLAVAVGRRQEAAIKLALGAPRRRLIREFLRESTIICGISAVLGYSFASMVIARFSEITFHLPMMGSYSVGLDLRLDTTVVAFTTALMLIAILATGLAPALYASSPNLAQILSGEIVVGGVRKNARRSALVIAQVAVCTLVLVGTGLCQRSLYNLRHSDPGFSARNLVAARIFPREGASEADSKQLVERLRGAVSALPGVESVSLASDLPLSPGYNEVQVEIPGSDKRTSVGQSVVDGDYFVTLGMPILAGRAFNSGDRQNGPQVVVINRKMAETFWPGQDAVGKSVATVNPPRKAIVIGVTVDGKYADLEEPARPAMYYALNQQYRPLVTLIARTKGDPRLWVEPISQTMRSFGLFIPIPLVTFNDLIDFNLIMQRVAAGCVAALSALGLLLAILGLFGAISYSVSERKKELGIRVALGARRRELMSMILRQTLTITGVGVAIGLVLGVLATMLLRSQFYGISPVEWTVLVPVSVVMLGVSLLVAYLSARPWLAIDAMEAVRHA
jgi:putative ABC transport system permease protein